MSIRKIIVIDEEKCDGCGLCVPACHEGALQIIDAKARLVSETYCDGLGDCLAECPQNAITIEEREVAAYDRKAVESHLFTMTLDQQSFETKSIHSGCPGSALRSLKVDEPPANGPQAEGYPSQLGHWPIQLMLVPPAAPFLKNSDLLICADCVPFAVPNFHGRYLSGKSLIVGCPKLDNLQYYYDKMKAIFGQAVPKSITILKMQVPCCTGIAQAAIQARNEINPQIPIKTYTVGIHGEELRCEEIDAGSASARS